jgi:hypothetical protein
MFKSVEGGRKKLKEQVDEITKINMVMCVEGGLE